MGKLYAEARRESVAARRKEKADLTALAKDKVRKVPRKQRKALREKLLNEIKARHKLFRETFPTYRKLKSKSYDVVKRLIENLKTWRLGRGSGYACRFRGLHSKSDLNPESWYLNPLVKTELNPES